jgi:hypothetical protein
VVLNNMSFESYSRWGEIKHGAPQGLLPGPLFLLIYINNIPKISNGNSKMSYLQMTLVYTLTTMNPQTLKTT